MAIGQNRMYVLVLFTLVPLCGLYSQSRVPKFSTRSDSILYYNAEKKLELLWKNTSMPDSIRYAHLDSVRNIMDIARRNQIGWLYIYRPNNSYSNLDSLIANRKVDGSSITRVSLTNNHWKRIPRELYKYTHVERIELVNTRIRKLPSRLQKMKNLTQVDIYNNTPDGPLKMGKNNVVRQLAIRADKPDALPRRYKQWSSLDSLDLRRCNLSQFPNINGLESLTKLSLTENKLTLNDLGKYYNSSLKVLQLGTNAIVEVPDGINHFPSLVKLNFQVNSISKVSPALGDLKNLEELSFYKNQLDSIPPCLYALSKLKRVDLYYNKIDEVDTEIKNLTSLEVLYLSHNHLTSLPSEIEDLTNLTELYLHHNLLSELPGGIQRLSSLQILRVNDNALAVLPEWTCSLPNLESLDVSSNSLTTLPEAIMGNQTLRILVMNNNPWGDLQKMYELTEGLKQKGVNVHTDIQMVVHEPGD